MLEYNELHEKFSLNYEDAEMLEGEIREFHDNEFLPPITKRNQDAIDYQTTPLRWVILFLYMNCIMIVSSVCSSLTPAA